MADDPYTVLGVPRTATEDDIRRAYRKLAKELHPDLNPANRAAAEERFKKVSGAYEVIGDAEKRKQYDRGEIDAGGRAQARVPPAARRRPVRRPHGGGRPRSPDDFSFGDIFSDLFGSMRGRGEPGSPFGVRGRDVRYSLEVDFLEAAAGAKKRVTLPDSGALDITVPQGVVDGQVLRLKGRGEPGRRGARARRRAGRDQGAPASLFQARRRRHRARRCRSPSTRRCWAPRSRSPPSPAACS